MRTGLDHLPQSKQRVVAHVVRVLFEEFEAIDATGTSKWKKQARLFTIVLYGSYAGGDWVDDPVGGYISDYDLLIVVNDERLTDFEGWSAAEDRLIREVTINQRLTAPVSFIVHTLTDVSAQLERGRPFFVDIVDQGIALYEAEGIAFAQPRNERHSKHWFSTAQRSRRTYILQRAEGDDVYWWNKSVFELHQATEQVYHCLLLTLTLCSPKSHRLNFSARSANKSHQR